jgi:hypothetical protein
MRHNVPGLFETENPGPEELKYMKWFERSRKYGCVRVNYSWGPEAFVNREATFKAINDVNDQVAYRATEPHIFWDELSTWERIKRTPMWVVNRIRMWWGKLRLYIARRFR